MPASDVGLARVQAKRSGGTRGRPKRWNASEEKALLAAFVRITVAISPQLDKSQVPWGQFAGIHHTTGACERRISFYRLITADKVPPAPPGQRRRKADLSKDNPFHMLTDVASEVYRLRQARREAVVSALLQSKMDELAEVKETTQISRTWSLALNPEPNPVLALAPERLRSVVPREELLRVLQPENFSRLPPGRLFVAQGPEEERLHTELRQMVDAFFEMIPVVRPLGLSSRVREVDDEEGLGGERGRVGRPPRPPRRLRGQLRLATKGLAGAVAGQAASLAAADGADWRVAAAASALLTAVHASDAAAAGEPAALLAAHTRDRVSAAAKVLCTARVLHSSREAALLVALTRQALSARDALVASTPPWSEVHSAQRAVATAAGAIDIPARHRGWGGLMAVILTGTTSGHLNLSLTFSPAPHTAAADLLDLDQFLPGSTFAVNVHNSTPPDPPVLHSGRLLSNPHPLSLAPHTPLFCRAAHPAHLETSPFRVAISDTLRAEPAFLGVHIPAPWARGATGSSRSVPADDRDPLQPQHAARLLQSAVAAVTLPLHSHLVAAGALPPTFVPPITAASDPACHAFGACLRAVHAAAERAGAAGVAMSALLQAVVAGSAADTGWSWPAEEGVAVMEAAVEVGRTLALRDGSAPDTAMLAMDQTLWPAVAAGRDASKHALACAGMQVAIAALRSSDRLTLRPHLGQSLTLLSSSAAAAVDTAPAATGPVPEPATPAASARQSANPQQPAIAAPWILPSGAVHWPTLRDVVWQVQCALAASPGIPEALLAEKLAHAVGQAHLAMLLQRMEAQGMLRCVALPMHIDCVARGGAEGRVGVVAELLATPLGLVPSIFGGSAARVDAGAEEALRVLPLVAHYFSEAGASLEADVEVYGQQAWT